MNKISARGEAGMFYGEYQHNLDQKGRVIMPAKLREGLGEKFIITRGLDNCLFAYSMDEWSRLESKIKELPFTDKNVRSFTRFFFGGACESETDKQGRVILPAYLREYAGLTKETYILGVSSRVEIWSAENWEAFMDSENADPEMFAEKMAELGI